MGTWDVGPFDNDAAADWCADLDDAPLERRADLIRDALDTAADPDEDYLDADLAAEAVAAAAVVAAQLPGATPLDSPYAPKSAQPGALTLPADLTDLAVRALDQVLGDDSEWRSLWEESADVATAAATVRALRDELADAT
ncbi:DUF4259 domain-containing protein [Asanoa siamensis]|uniref:DUF4259 domain-containing protein n=1 Tax=Asanoa siamensis TaxID=926357 RepID=A0ABQ4CKN7_9ACTN|nr:DUF4259 domain-containing protein [Asanoa siamensis]GIF71407.1 hypothetical protein Asi02nite_09250 [Asanoa siamensis]